MTRTHHFFKNAFAFPLPWRAGCPGCGVSKKAKAAYKLRFALYMKVWVDAQSDDGWTTGGKDIQSALVGGSIKVSQLLRDARNGRVSLGKCTTRDGLMAMGAARAYGVQFAALNGDAVPIMALEGEFKQANLEFMRDRE